jgi:hypothetical protein
VHRGQRKMQDNSISYRRPVLWPRLMMLVFVVLFIVSFFSEVTLVLGWLFKSAQANILLFFCTFRLLSCENALFSVVFDDETERALWILMTNLTFYVTFITLFTFWTAQFSLPVRSLKKRFQAFYRIILYFWGRHGPALFIKNGKKYSSQGEEESVLPGVILADLSSAVVLEQQKNTWAWRILESQQEQERDSKTSSQSMIYWTRRILRPLLGRTPPWVTIHPPGVIFTEWGQKLTHVIDLRKQIRTELDVKSFTRDGVELNNIVFAVFSLSDSPDVITVGYVGGNEAKHIFGLVLDKRDGKSFIKEKFLLDDVDQSEIHNFVVRGLSGNSNSSTSPRSDNSIGSTPYPFNEERIFSAAYAQALVQVNNDDATTPWDELPQKVAVNLFRKQLEKYTFEQLFEMDSPDTYPLAQFKSDFSWQAKLQGVLSYKIVRLVNKEQDDEKTSWEANPFSEEQIGIQSPENQTGWDEAELKFSEPHEFTSSKVLRDRGIKVIAVGFPEFRPANPEVQAQIIEKWKIEWENRFQNLKSENELAAIRAKNRIRARAQREMVYTFSNIRNSSKYSKEALALRIFQALEDAATNPLDGKDLTPKEIMAMLRNVHWWLLNELPNHNRKNPNRPES